MGTYLNTFIQCSKNIQMNYYQNKFTFLLFLRYYIREQTSITMAKWCLFSYLLSQLLRCLSTFNKQTQRDQQTQVRGDIKIEIISVLRLIELQVYVGTQVVICAKHFQAQRHEAVPPFVNAPDILQCYLDHRFRVPIERLEIQAGVCNAHMPRVRHQRCYHLCFALHVQLFRNTLEPVFVK